MVMKVIESADPLERRRDLKSQVNELAGEDEQEIVIRDTSPNRKYVVLYMTTNGEPITMPRHLAEKAIEKRLENGNYMFTANAEAAPAYVMGTTRCFLHAESPERLSGALDEVGLAGVECPAGQLASNYSKRMHARNRHGQQWLAYQEHMEAVDRDEWRQRELEMHEVQKQQLEATRKLAEQVAQPAAKVTKKNQGEAPAE